MMVKNERLDLFKLVRVLAYLFFYGLFIYFMLDGGRDSGGSNRMSFIPPKRKLNPLEPPRPQDDDEDDAFPVKRRHLAQFEPDQLLSSNSEYQAADIAARTLSIGNLPFTATETSVKHIFKDIDCTIEQVIFLPLKDRKQRGLIASVILENSAQVEKCRTSLDGIYLGEGFWLRAWIGRDAGLNTRLERTGIPFNASPLIDSFADGNKIAPPSSVGLSNIRGRRHAELFVHVKPPSSLAELRRIHGMVENVIKFGPEFEALIMQRERMNPDFAFLFDCDLPEHIYYRWKLWSLCKGDSLENWDTTPSEIFLSSAAWIPPHQFEWSIDDELARLDGEDMDDEEQAQKKRAQASPFPSVIADRGPAWLGPIIKLHLTLLLQHISMRRGAIARVMAFAIDNAYAAEEIVDTICSSVQSRKATTQLRVARLWAIGDILYNAGMGVGGVSKGVWKYRNL